MFGKSTRMLLILSLMLSFQLSFAAEQKNYCNDSKSWKEWDALIEKYPNDEDVQILWTTGRTGTLFFVWSFDFTWTISLRLNYAYLFGDLVHSYY